MQQGNSNKPLCCPLAGQVFLETSQAPVLTLQGSVLRSYRECTRDEEWQLLQLELCRRMNGSRDTATILAECSGGDALRLRAPIDVHGAEQTELSACAPDARSDVNLDFTCHTILVSLLNQHLPI